MSRTKVGKIAMAGMKMAHSEFNCDEPIK